VSDDYEGIVYDLDGTLVHLAVDWDAVRSDVAAVYEAAGIEIDADLWTMLEDAAEHDLEAAVESTIAGHERDGARDSRRLPLADELAGVDRPTAVCSLNCEAACRIALDVHELTDAVDVVVGRDTVTTPKPDPEPLEHAIGELGLRPEQCLFVGDSHRDARTAERAGVPFKYVRELTDLESGTESASE